MSHFCTHMVPDAGTFIDSVRPKLELAFRQTFADQISAFCLLATFTADPTTAEVFEEYVPQISRLLRGLMDAEDSQKIGLFFLVMNFCMQNLDSEKIEQMCPTLAIVDSVLLSQNYTFKVELRDYLRRRFLKTTFQGDAAIEVLDRMLELSVWFYSNEIDEATAAFDDFRGILNWF